MKIYDVQTMEKVHFQNVLFVYSLRIYSAAFYKQYAFEWGWDYLWNSWMKLKREKLWDMPILYADRIYNNI